MLNLTPENYHSTEAAKTYFSASRYKEMAGTLGIVPCEARALATINGTWVEQPTTAMLCSSYVDCHFAGRLDIFKAQNPDIFTKGGELKAQFKHAETIIQRIERDPYFMKFLSGRKQVIFTAELFGVTWSCMVDSFIDDIAIVDLKVMAELTKAFWLKDYGYMSFVEYYGYLEQAAIYQAVVEKNIGKKLPVYLAAASKEDEPDIEIIGFPQSRLDEILTVIESRVPRMVAIRSGQEEPTRCNSCDYCRKMKVLTGPISFTDLVVRP